MATRAEALQMLDDAMREGKLNRANELRRRLDMPPIGVDGGSFSDRAAASTARGPGAQQQTLENRLGPDNVQAFGDDNFVIPGESGPTLFNPPGFDTGDLGFLPRAGAEVFGALTGGFLGSVGGLPGVMLGAGLGGESAGTLYDAGMRAFGGVEDFRSPGQAVYDTGMGVAFNSMGGPTPARPGAAMMNAQQMTNDAAFREALRAANVPPLTPGQMGSPMGQRFEGALESTLTGGPVLDRQRQGVTDAMRSYIDGIYPGDLSREAVGDRVITGVGTVADDLKLRGKEIYDRLDDLINSVDEGSISIPESQNLLDEFKTRILKDPEYARLLNTDPDMARYISTLENALRETEATTRIIPEGKPRVGSSGNMEQPTRTEVVDEGKEAAFPLYDTIKRFRTNVGSKLSNPFAMTAEGGVEAEKRHLYGVLSDDLAAGADELGGVGAVHTRKRADQFHRTMMDRLGLIDPIFKNADNPTRVYEILGTMVQNNPRALAAAKKTMPRETWDDFADSYMQRLLHARPGGENATLDAISFPTIATNLNNLKRKSPEAWRLLTGDKRAALENVVILANRFRESEKYFNRSRTANSMGTQGLLTAPGVGASTGFVLGHSPGAAAVGASAAFLANTVIPWMAAKVITSPSIRKAVERMPTTLMGDVTPATLARSLIAAGADEDEVQELLQMEGQ